MTKRGLRLLAGLAVAFVALLGLAVPASAASPAAAPAVVSSWKTVTTDGSWHCFSYQNHAYHPTVRFRACTVVNGHYAQMVLQINNNTTSTITIDGLVDNYNRGYTSCGDLRLGAGGSRGCFGQTFYLACGDVISGKVYATVNGDVDSMLGYDRSAC